MDEPLTPGFRARLVAACERALRVRREILLLAGHAAGHLPGVDRACRECGDRWPCAAASGAARPALDAYAELPP